MQPLVEYPAINEKKNEMEITLSIVREQGVSLPAYATSGSVGMDIHAMLDETVTLRSGERRLIPTGLKIELPEGFEAQIRPRSGLALKYGVTVLNTPGTIDTDYRGEIGVILINLGQEDFEIRNGDRIAQLVVAAYSQVKWNEVLILNNTVRGDGAYGHTGE